MTHSTQTINEVVSDLVHVVDVRQHLVQWQHLTTENTTRPVPLFTLSVRLTHTRHQYDVMESRDVSDDVTERHAVGTLLYRLPIGHEPINRLVFEIFDIKVGDTQTHTHRHVD